MSQVHTPPRRFREWAFACQQRTSKPALFPALCVSLVTTSAVLFTACSSSEHGTPSAIAGSAGIDRALPSGAASGGADTNQEQGGSGSGTPTAGTDSGTASGGKAAQGGTNSATAGGGGASNGDPMPSAGNAGMANDGSYWKPKAGTSWQWQLTGTIDKTVDVSVYDIDGFDNDESVVKALHAQGRKVICYLSVGSYEDWRPDAKSFPAAVLGNDYPGWPGERFVDIRAKALRDIMAQRLDLCRRKGFDGIEPDNMDVYSAKSGFPLTEKDGLDYADWLASEAHARGLNIGQKNAPEIAMQLEPSFDWVLTEDCYDQGWCADVSIYAQHDKPVFMSEYTDTGVDFKAACSWGVPKKYSPILKGRDLDAAIQFCP